MSIIGIFKTSIYCVVTLLLMHGLPSAIASTTFHEDGTIVIGDYHLRMNASGRIRLVDPTGASSHIYTNVWFRDKLVEVPKDGGEGAEILIDETNHSVTYKYKLTPEGEKSFDAMFSVTVLPSNAVQISLILDIEPSMEGLVVGKSRILIPRQALVGGNVQIGDLDYWVDGERHDEEQQRVSHFDSDEPIILQAADGHGIFNLVPVTANYVMVTDVIKSSYRSPFVAAVFTTLGGQSVFDIVFPEPEDVVESSDTYAGIDFWKLDRLHMPEYDASRNLIQNPGFEADFKYWRWNTLGFVDLDTTPSYDQYYSLSEENPYEGQSCLAIRAEPGVKPAQAATFAIPVRKGQEYTLSFYARGDAGQFAIEANAQGFFAPKTWLWEKVKLSQEWKRYEFTIKAAHPVLSVGFTNPNMKDGFVYVDNIQLEEGAEATEYTTKPVIAWLESKERSRIWQPGEDPEVVLKLSGTPGASGSVRAVQTGFFDDSIDRGTYTFTLDDKGAAAISMPWAEELDLGIYVIEMETRLNDEDISRDFDRLAVVRFLDNTQKNKDIFSASIGLSARYPEWERDTKFFRDMGIGSMVTFNLQPHKYIDILIKNGIQPIVSILDDGQGFKEQKWKQHDEKRFNLTEEELNALEDEAFRRASEFPEITWWKLFNEPEREPYIDNIPAMNRMVKALRALQSGILRANPDAIIQSPDPANMYPNSGMAFINTLLEVVGDNPPFDVVAIHPYRARPEEPNLNTETQLLLDLLDRHDFKGDVWFTEGIYHQNYIVPAWELNTHTACTSDHFRTGAASYAMGWGERMAAAYTARSWLVALKYGDRVKVYTDWGYRLNTMLDINHTPGASIFASNTLGNLLGNATFSREINLGHEVHCFVFNDEKDAPIAVLWYSNVETDKGLKLGPDLNVSKLANSFPKMTYMDFMGDSHELSDVIRLSPFPVFIRGNKDNKEQFLSSLQESSIVGGIGEIIAYANVDSRDHVSVNIQNMVNRTFDGEYSIQEQDGQSFTGDIQIEPTGTWRYEMEQEPKSNAVNRVAFDVSISPKDSEKPLVFEMSKEWMCWPKRKLEKTLSGNLDEWADAFNVELKNTVSLRKKKRGQEAVESQPEVMSAKLYAAWDEAALYLAFYVRDKHFYPSEDSANAWKGDSVQLYFDAWADAGESTNNGYGPDDQAFIVQPTQPGGILYRDTPPERQLTFLDAGVVDSAEVVVHELPDAIFYEIRIPVEELAPIMPASGKRFGFAALVNNNDGEGRDAGLTLTPPETEPFRNPKLYPTVVLVP